MPYLENISPLISYHIQVFLLIDWRLIYGSKKVGYLVLQYKYPLSLFSSSCSVGSFSFTRQYDGFLMIWHLRLRDDLQVGLQKLQLLQVRCKGWFLEVLWVILWLLDHSRYQ